MPSTHALTREELLSPGLAFARRDQRERILEHVTAEASKGLIKQAESFAMDGEAPNPAMLSMRWEHALESALKTAPMDPATMAEAYTLLREDPLPLEVYDTTLSVLADARDRNLTRQEMQLNMREALRLDTGSSSITAALSTGGMSWTNRFKRTARTVGTGLEGWAVVGGLWLFGIGHKRWVTRRDERVRHTHDEADGQTVLRGDPFIIGGVPMMYPAARNGPPEEVFNCRCVVVGVLRP